VFAGVFSISLSETDGKVVPIEITDPLRVDLERPSKMIMSKFRFITD
jgi:hypothetical protein